MGDQKDQRSSDEIEQDLEKTRRDMHDAVDALEDKFTVGQLLDQVWSRISGDRSVRTMAANAGAAVRAHPIPLALVGVGVAWLVIEKATSSKNANADGPSMMDKAKDKLSGAAEVAKDWTGNVSDSGEDLPDGADEGVHGVGEHVRRRGTQVKNGFRSAMEAQPLVVGAVAFGLGLASGMAAPSSRWEDKTMGGTADSLRKGVKGMVKEAAHAATDVAQDTLVAAKEEARRQNITGSLSDSARQIADHAKQTAKQRWEEESAGFKERVAHAGERVEEEAPVRQL